MKKQKKFLENIVAGARRKKELEIVKSGNSIGGNKRETEYDAGYIEAICALCKKPLWLAARIVLSDDNPLKEQENELIKSSACIVMKNETQPQTFLTNPNNGARMFSVFTSLEAGRNYVDNCQSKGVIAITQTSMESVIKSIRENDYGVTRIVIDMKTELEEDVIKLAERIIREREIVVKL